MARAYTLAASAARTASASGSGVLIDHQWERAQIVLRVTASADEAGDTLDVYVDVSPDNSAWFPAVHYAQQAGNGAAKTEFAVLCPVDPGTSTINVTSDPAAGAVRPALHGKYMRARWAIADSGDADSSHTFSVTAYA